MAFMDVLSASSKDYQQVLLNKMKNKIEYNRRKGTIVVH